jgi:hypothetical protein
MGRLLIERHPALPPFCDGVPGYPIDPVTRRAPLSPERPFEHGDIDVIQQSREPRPAGSAIEYLLSRPPARIRCSAFRLGVPQLALPTA